LAGDDTIEKKKSWFSNTKFYDVRYRSQHIMSIFYTLNQLMGREVQSGKIFFGHLFLVLTQEREGFVITHIVIKVEHNPLFPPPFHYTKREKCF
jgi:hypothetical protein